MKTEYHKIRIATVHGDIEFEGKYRRDLETKNWHYYEKDDGKLMHFRKIYMVMVEDL